MCAGVVYYCRWFRVSDSKALYPVPSSHRVIPSQTLLLIKNADERADGQWVSIERTHYHFTYWISHYYFHGIDLKQTMASDEFSFQYMMMMEERRAMKSINYTYINNVLLFHNSHEFWCSLNFLFSYHLRYVCYCWLAGRAQVCKASNQFGEQRVEIRLHVNTYLSVHIHPQVQIVNSGGTALFNCSITGSGTEEVEWFHDGTLLQSDTSLTNNNK